jgi:hypothetical protein
MDITTVATQGFNIWTCVLHSVTKKKEPQWATIAQSSI